MTIIKLLEENIRQILHNIGCGNDFLDMTPKAQAIKEKIDRFEFMKIKSFCASKDTIHRVKRQNETNICDIYNEIYMIYDDVYITYNDV